MTLDTTLSDSQHAVGTVLYDCVTDLFPICRSITGDGLRQTLARLAQIIPLSLHEVPSGTAVFDWVVPDEWNIRDAFVKNRQGERVIDFRRSNLHVVNYSTPIHATMSLQALRAHLFSLPERPDWIPYRTSYYEKGWGFCLSQRQLDALPEDEYEVCIDSSLAPGALTYGEFLLPGASREEILISCHVCHPSLANDNLSAAVIGAHLARRLQNLTRRYSYRFLFIPGTIGSLTWLAHNEADLHWIRHGLVLTCLGDPGPFTYKKSRRGNCEVDRVVQAILRERGAHRVVEFSPYGYDERQYCSPGFDLPVGRLSRSANGCYPEYHTSADDLQLVRPEALAASLAICLEICTMLERNRCFLNLNPKGEPQLGRRGLYHAMGEDVTSDKAQMAVLWVLNLADGNHSLLDVAERSTLAFALIARAAELLCEHGLLRAVP